MCDALASEVTTKNYYLRYKVVLDAVIEHFSESIEGLRDIEPHVRQDKESQIRKIRPNPRSKLNLNMERCDPHAGMVPCLNLHPPEG